MSTQTTWRSVEVPERVWAEVEARVPDEERAEFLEQALMDGLLRRAAERARHYYETDEDARAWADSAGDLVEYGDQPPCPS